MRKAILLAAVLGVAPVAAFASGGMGGYGGGGYGGGNSMTQDNGREDLQKAVKLIEKEDFAGAIPHLRAALRANQGNADILNLLGFTSRMVGNYDDSLDYYQRALARNPDHKGAHEYLGELYLMMHQPDNARGQLAELTRLCPSGCAEKDALVQAITSYDASAKTTPPGTTTSTPGTPAPAATPTTPTASPSGQQQ